MDCKILVVDDSFVDMALITSMLSDYITYTAANGKIALDVIRENPDIDVMILDINMPVMNGFEVLEALKKMPEGSKLMTLVLTNYDELENEIRGLELGAVDYIRKPLNIESLRKRIEIHAKLKTASKTMEALNLELERKVQQRTQELILTRDITIHALIGLLEIRDIESSNHTKRTQKIIRALCEQLKSTGEYDILTEGYMKEIYETAPLHDIGKVGIPDGILLKPAKLTAEEFEFMKKHTTFGVNALMFAVAHDTMPSFIKTAIECIGTHHEKYDGSGYPSGLSGETIPLAGRLMAIADVYDALISKRVYKEAFSHQVAKETILKERGRHFDPKIVDAFMAIEEKILAIVAQYNQAS